MSSNRVVIRQEARVVRSLIRGPAGTTLSTDIANALAAASSPSTGNPFVTTTQLQAAGGIDWTTPVTVSAATTLTVGKHHVIVDQTIPASYTVNLPDVAASIGRLVSVALAADMTKRVTISAGAALIDGVSTRLMWALESALLWSDGVSWTKVAGRSVPMHALLYPTSAVAVSNSGTIVIPMQASAYDHGGFLDGANQRIYIPRKSDYTLVAVAYFQAGTYDSKLHSVVPELNATSYLANTQAGFLPATSVGMAVSTPITQSYELGDFIKVYAQHQSASTPFTRNLYTGNKDWTRATILEVPAW